jgi:hypothetical protein
MPVPSTQIPEKGATMKRAEAVAKLVLVEGDLERQRERNKVLREEVQRQAAEIVGLRAEVALGYDATQEEIDELRRALAQVGHAAPQSNEALGIEYVRYAKRVISAAARAFQQQERTETK